jgi:hypothetical protein
MCKRLHIHLAVAVLTVITEPSQIVINKSMVSKTIVFKEPKEDFLYNKRRVDYMKHRSKLKGIIDRVTPELVSFNMGCANQIKEFKNRLQMA